MDMPASPFSGRTRWLDAQDKELETQDCQLLLQDEALSVAPRKGQAAYRVDFSDLDGFARGDHLVRLRLATGESIEVSMLGRRFDEFADSTALRLCSYQAKHLLLDEPKGGESFRGEVARGGRSFPAEIRLYLTSLAVLPRDEVPFDVPFGEIGEIAFAEDRYAIDLELPEGKLSLQKLGKFTQPCLRLLEGRLSELGERTAAALAYLLPKLTTVLARRVGRLLRDGVTARQGELDEVDPGIWPALVEASLGTEALRESLKTLATLCPAGEMAAGLKETNARQDAQEDVAEGQAGDCAEESSEPEAEAEAEAAEPMEGKVVWFVAPILHEDRARPGNALAVEAATRENRATYLFRLVAPDRYRTLPYPELIEEARRKVRVLSRALVSLHFKREPIYLPKEKLETGRYARYKLAMRLSRPLREARDCFLGRAIHTNAWKTQLEAALKRALE